MAFNPRFLERLTGGHGAWFTGHMTRGEKLAAWIVAISVLYFASHAVVFMVR